MPRFAQFDDVRGQGIPILDVHMARGYAIAQHLLHSSSHRCTSLARTHNVDVRVAAQIVRGITDAELLPFSMEVPLHRRARIHSVQCSLQHGHDLSSAPLLHPSFV